MHQKHSPNFTQKKTFYTEKDIFSSYFFCLLLSSIGFVREAHCCDARCREQQDFFPPPISLTHSHYITLNPSLLDSNWVQSRTLSIPHVAPINLHQALKMNKKVWGPGYAPTCENSSKESLLSCRLQHAVALVSVHEDTKNSFLI